MRKLGTLEALDLVLGEQEVRTEEARAQAHARGQALASGVQEGPTLDALADANRRRMDRPPVRAAQRVVSPPVPVSTKTFFPVK